ncbi:MAG: class I SAM-dependent RNA methyltransferase, partial [Terriglobia bacterium]
MIPLGADFETAAQTLDASIEKLVYGGEGLARTPEGVVLVAGVIPDERVSLRLEERKKGVRRASLLEVAAASPDRVEAGCPYYGRCGGCQYQHISYSRQLALKQDIL